MELFSKTRKSHRWNEDRFINGKNYFIVIDGATPLKSVCPFNEAHWMVSYIKGHINRYCGSVKEKLLSVCRDAFFELPEKIYDEDYLPSAGCSWVEFEGGQIKVGILGDCEVTLISRDNKIVRCFSDELNKLDTIALTELKRISKQNNLHVFEARKQINDLLIKNRKLINKVGGYSALTISPHPIINEKQYVFDKKDFKEIYLYSDGFSQAFENLKIYKSHGEMFENMGDIGEEIEKIKRASFSDPFGDAFPRFKLIDDITVTKIVL